MNTTHILRYKNENKRLFEHIDTNLQCIPVVFI